MRGEQEARQFSEAIIQTLNNEQNRDKRDWHSDDLWMLREGIKREMAEMESEITSLGLVGEDRRQWFLQRAAEEAVDVAAFAMFVWDRARRELEDE